MYQQIITLENQKRLILSWSKDWSDFTIRHNQDIIGTIPNKSDLQIGRNINVPGTGVVFIRLNIDHIEVWFNGKELVTNTINGQKDHFKTAYYVIFSVAVLQAIGGLLFISIDPTWLIFGAMMAITAILVGLGVWAKMAKSVAPLWVMVVILTLLFLSNVVMRNIIGAIVIGVMLYYLVKGAQAGPLLPVNPVTKLEDDEPLDAGV